MLIVWFFIFLLYFRYYKNRKKSTGSKKPVANSKYMEELESYKKALKKYTLLIRLMALFLAFIFLLIIILSIRPAAKTIERPDLTNRDIMLCLDVSGSMRDTDGKVVESFAELAKGFKGERIGMVIFDSSAVTLFPLTDDYDYVIDILNKTKATFNSKNYSSSNYDLYTGTTEGRGSSLIGDGLASCVLRFDKLGTKRSRSVILATDNYTNGAQIVDLKQAGALAKKNDVRVYGLNPYDSSSEYYKDKNSTEFREVVLSTNGDYYKFDSPGSISGIISKISQQEATRFKGSPILVISDKPQLLIFVIVLSTVILLFIVWRLGI